VERKKDKISYRKKIEEKYGPETGYGTRETQFCFTL
jgi:hypothetical protein